ncbi:MAG TPA: hypothetical protein VLB27_03310, partial [candidate division Zixibacteria bacterium]|nr:hypothetical protein [candidate division Zixibacteria bacterium]
PNVREIFELLEFDTILRDYPSADQAARSFQQGERPLEGGPRGPSAHSGGTLEELSAIGVDQPLSMIAGHMESRGESRSIDPLRRLAEQVAEDPFASIGELRDLLNDGGGGAPVGWWWTFRSLVNLGLLSRRARFRFARRRSKAGPV